MSEKDEEINPLCVKLFLTKHKNISAFFIITKHLDAQLLKSFLIILWLVMTWRSKEPGPHLNIKIVFPGMGISIIKMRRPWDGLIFINENSYSGKTTSLYWDGPQVISSMVFQAQYQKRSIQGKNDSLYKSIHFHKQYQYMPPKMQLFTENLIW